MKRNLYSTVVAVAVALVAVRPSSGAPHSAEQLEVGLARVCITPDEPVWLHGYASKSRSRPYTSVMDDIYATAMAVKTAGGEPAVLITADLCVLREPEETALSAVVMRKTGLERGQILLNWSHTHSGPVIGVSDRNRYLVADEDLRRTEKYTESLWTKLAAVAADAIADLRPAQLSWGAGQADFVKNRRQFDKEGRYRGMGPNPDRYVDRRVPVLRIDNPDGKLRGVVFGCACHAVTLGASSPVLSGDYPSFARQHIEQQLPGVTTLFLQGCGADANPDPRATKDQAEVVQRQGRTLGAEVCRVLEESKLQPVRGPLRVRFDRIDLPMKPVPDAEKLAQLTTGPFWESHNAKRILAAQQRGETIPTHYRAPLALWQFGKDLTLVAISGEVVSDYVPLVSDMLGSERLWVAGYCNQVFGYLPSARVVREGGYETLGLVSAHIGWFSSDAQDVLLEGIRKMYQDATRQTAE